MSIINIPSIVALHKNGTIFWHHQAPAVVEIGLLGLVEANHMHNFTLWHEEDKARRNDMGFEYVYNAKRSIDKHNQLRNNFVEKIDQHILEFLPSMNLNSPNHSETPGMIIDRLSILSLKAYHMAEECERTDADPEHIQKCKFKLSVINKQSNDLVNALNHLLDEVQQGKKHFNVYFQFKMYNDPSLNPQLYKNNLKLEAC